MLNRERSITNSRDGTQLLFSEKSLCSDKSIPTFIPPFSSKYDEIVTIIRRYLPTLYKDPIMDTILQDGIHCVAYRAKSLDNTLSPSNLQEHQNETWLKCKGFF